jgi:hypothetical protein
VHQNHGPIVRLGPKELSVNSLHGLKTIYTGAFEKHAFYNAVNPVAGEGGCKVGVGDGRYGREEVGVYHMVVYEVGPLHEDRE